MKRRDLITKIEETLLKSEDKLFSHSCDRYSQRIYLRYAALRREDIALELI
ncbi:hypothetical protein GNF10_04140 [Nostoc sp. UCD121]|uniref:hypothetical protein n=1 Tax=unclassified Nostoc TaxID=2593658 RepID=UPI0016241D00|nr:MULTISPECIES: hypothetical protein [unclassified Nostoc]MBC1222404.1 hypothetical protein [Nostoc sp. UCD120]MBC1275194.1 hypothetical protein [Nostoc sp. UCD121]MBC1294104.1 hypothetical protein [Nostoc sp. UCD122]